MARGKRIPESQHGRGWQGPLWVTQPNPLPKQGHPELAAQDLVQGGLITPSQLGEKSNLCSFLAPTFAAPTGKHTPTRVRRRRLLTRLPGAPPAAPAGMTPWQLGRAPLAPGKNNLPRLQL